MTHRKCLFAVLVGLVLVGCSSPADDAAVAAPSSSGTNAASEDPDAAGCPGAAADSDAGVATGPQRTETPVERCTGEYFADTFSGAYPETLDEFLHSDGTTCMLGRTTELRADGTAIEHGSSANTTGTWKGDVAYFTVRIGAKELLWQPNDPRK